MKDLYQYFIGVGLPEKESKLFSVIKQELHPKGNLSSPAHITLMAPFFWKNEKELISKISNWSAKQEGFSAEFEKVQSFKQPKYTTIFLAPEKSGDFKKLYISVHKLMRINYRGSFVPHLTLGQRVPYENFEEIKKRLKDMKISLELKVGAVSLYRRKVNEEWKEFRSFKFSKFA